MATDRPPEFIVQRGSPGRTAEPRPWQRRGTRSGRTIGFLAEQPCRQVENRSQEFKDSSDNDSKQPEWQEQEPYEGIRDQGKQGQRPPDRKQDQPQQEFRHRARPGFSLAHGPEPDRGVVPHRGTDDQSLVEPITTSHAANRHPLEAAGVPTAKPAIPGARSLSRLGIALPERNVRPSARWGKDLPHIVRPPHFHRLNDRGLP